MMEGQVAKLDNSVEGLPPVRNFPGGSDVTLSLPGHLFV